MSGAAKGLKLSVCRCYTIFNGDARKFTFPDRPHYAGSTQVNSEANMERMNQIWFDPPGVRCPWQDQGKRVAVTVKGASTRSLFLQFPWSLIIETMPLLKGDLQVSQPRGKT